MVTVSVVHCDESKRSWLERRNRGIAPDGPTFAYGTVSMPRSWHVAAFRDRDAVFGVGVVRRGNRITDLEFRLHLAAFRAAAPAPTVAAIANVLRGYSDAVHNNGLLTEARGARLLEAIRQLVPDLRPTTQEFMQWVDGRPIPGAAGEQLGMEKDAIGTLLEVAGLTRSILTRWVDSGGVTAFIHGLPQQLPPRAGAAQDGAPATLYVTDAAEEYQPALPIEQPIPTRPERHHWVNEDLLIQFDHQRFANWIEVPSAQVGWRRYRNSAGTQTISVYYANRTPVESTLGTDLVYFHERHGCYVLLQYKKMSMEDGATDWGYRPDRHLGRELQRMREVDDLCRRTEERRSIAEFRLLPTPSFVKLCEPQSLVAASSEWIPGMYLAREQFEALLQAPESVGPRGGVRLSYRNVPRHLNTTTFTTLLRDGWLGSRGAGTDQIKAAVDQALTEGRAVLVGVHSTERPLGNSRRRTRRQPEGTPAAGVL
jgi:hypothetical protein